MALSIIGALAAAAGAASSIYSTATRDQSGPARSAELSQDSLADARSNEAYQRAVSALTNQRAVAGTEDQYGSTVRYDPATNKWISRLGELPLASDTASLQAGIRQNTTQSRLNELANEQAAVRAARAGPGADQAQRNLTNFQPMSRDQLVGLLTQQGTTSARSTYDPIVQSTLRNYVRTGVNAGPVLANLGSTEADTLRKTLMDAQISGLTNTDSVNESKRSGLENAATTATAFANPSFQSSSVAPSSTGKELASLLTSRAQGSALYPSYGTSNVNAASKGTSDALSKLINSASTLSVNPGADIAKELSALGQNKNIQQAISSWFGDSSSSNSWLPENEKTLKSASNISSSVF